MSNDSRWQADIVETKPFERRLETGNRFEWLVKFMGRRRTPAEVVELEPNRIFKIRILEGDTA